MVTRGYGERLVLLWSTYMLCPVVKDSGCLWHFAGSS